MNQLPLLGRLHRSEDLQKRKKNIHISEARVVKVIDERPYIFVTLPNGDKKLALYDTGAICCCVKPSVFEQLQQNSLISWNLLTSM